MSTGPSRAPVFSDLDQLYKKILNLYPKKETLIRVLGGIVALGPRSYEATACLLNVGRDELASVLRATTSLIEIFTTGEELEVDDQDLHRHYATETGIRFYHLSMRDFLLDNTRSGSFHVNLQDIYNLIFTRYINLTALALQDSPSYNFVYGAQALCHPSWEPHVQTIGLRGGAFRVRTPVAYHIGWSVIQARLNDLRQALNGFRASNSGHTVVFPQSILLRHLNQSKWELECIKERLDQNKKEVPNVDTTEIDEMLSEVQIITDWCFRRILSAAGSQLFECLPYFVETGLPVNYPFHTFQQLCNQPGNSDSRTTAFLVNYKHLICTTKDYLPSSKGTPIIRLTYRLIPGLFSFLSSSSRAGIFHIKFRKRFIQIIAQAPSNSLIHQLKEPSKFQSNFFSFVYIFFNHMLLSDVKPNENAEGLEDMRRFLSLLCQRASDWAKIPDKFNKFTPPILVIKYIHRQLNQPLVAASLGDVDERLPQKILATMTSIIESDILPHFLHPYFSEMWLVDRKRVLQLDFPCLSHDGDQPKYVEEEISVSHLHLSRPSMLSRNFFQASYALAKILEEANDDLPFDRAQMSARLLEFELLFFAKKLYVFLHPRSDQILDSQTLGHYRPYPTWFRQAYPTAKALLGPRALCYMFSISGVKWDPVDGFSAAAAVFLNKYNLHPRDRLLFDIWLKDLHPWERGGSNSSGPVRAQFRIFTGMERIYYRGGP